MAVLVLLSEDLAHSLRPRLHVYGVYCWLPTRLSQQRHIPTRPHSSLLLVILLRRRGDALAHSSGSIDSPEIRSGRGRKGGHSPRAVGQLGVQLRVKVRHAHVVFGSVQ